MTATVPHPQSRRRMRKEETIEVRVAAPTKALLSAAASVRHASLSQFMLASAVREAENALAEQRVFQVSDANWAVFMDILGAPAEPDADIAALARSRAPWGP